MWRLLFVMLLFSLSRILFWLLNAEYFQGVSMLSFFGGLRFDLAMVCMLNSLLILASLFPIAAVQRQLWYSRFMHALYVAVNGLALGFDLADAEYFKFTLKRSTADLISLMGTGDDVFNLIPSFVSDYWYLVLIWLLVLYSLWKIGGRTYTRPLVFTGWKTWLNWAVVWVVIVASSVVASRGGLQLKPLSLLNAGSYGGNRYVPLVLNTPFSIIRTAGKVRLDEVNYLSEQEAASVFNPRRRIVGNAVQSPNVVIIILESFAEEYISSLSGKKGYAPFMDSLVGVSTRAEQAFANGRKSMEAVPAILSGIPAWMTSPYISSSYSANEINSLPKLLKPLGYTSLFFHGGNNGTMGFDVFARTAGYDKYIGRNEYPNSEDYDGQWGIYDEPFLQFFADELDRLEQPFQCTVFTLSSHHPYKLPERYEGKFPEGSLAIHRTISYTDYALQRFFERVKRSPWSSNTLFVITADHTHHSEWPEYSTKMGQYRVPLLFYSPLDTAYRVISGAAQHIDILPTVLERTGFQGEVISFGESLFDENRSGLVMNYINGTYQINNERYLAFFDGEQISGLFDFKSDSLLQEDIRTAHPEIAAEFELQAKARIQSYNTRMNRNALSTAPGND